ncbi:TM2 domain-containing protein [Populibacterium corticicola]|jgi:TM2 domain-containing membrane protein YozV|uniref:TM2 domain-containing protein n=1 Tax=Populibacterium corticicola TaxID=1812826 RepID=A0ABW5XL27_9MICO
MSTPNDPASQTNPYGGQSGNSGNPYQSGQPYGGPQQGQPYQQQPYGQQGPYGGQQPPYMQPPTGQKSKIVAGILGILLGVFGVHNFYLGNTGKAVAQLLITVVSVGTLAVISSIWGLVEGILILVSKPGDPWHRDARGFELQD